MRKPIVAGNWKMNKTVAEARDLVREILVELENFQGVDVVVCPPFTALAAVSETLGGAQIHLGAQNMHWEKSGAYTGEVSAPMLRELFCHFVILGHSERRAYFQESDDVVNRKVKAALNGNVTPIVCVGETLEERESGDTERVVERQARGSLAGLSESELGKIVLAYEPVWAIGTGRTASPEQAQDVHALIREVLGNMGGRDVAEAVRIQYGGSVKADNAGDLFRQPDIDGGLIGGASLDPRSFVKIVQAAR
jgi:triosephosphate isomerase